MEEEYDPGEVPLSRVLSDRSLEEDRPGFFDLSTSDDIIHRFNELAQESTTSSRIHSPSEDCYLRPEYNCRTHSSTPIVTVTDWTDPSGCCGGDTEERGSPVTSARSSISDLSDIQFSLGDRWNSATPMMGNSKGKEIKSESAIEQDMAYGKPPVLLQTQVRQRRAQELKDKKNFPKRIWDFIRKHCRSSLTPSGFRSLIRCLAGFVVVSILLIIPSTAKWIGPVDVLTCSGLIFFPPNKTLGAQLEASLLGAIFILLAGVYNYAGLACLVAFNTSDHATDYGASLIAAVWLIFATLVLGYLRTKYSRLYTPCVAAQITLFFALFMKMRVTELSFSIVWSINRPLLLAIAITCICSLVIFPRSATGKLADETRTALRLTSELLEDTVKTFLIASSDAKLPEELDVLRGRLRSSLSALNAVGREAMYEVSVGRFAPWDYIWIGSNLTGVGQTLGSMLLLVVKEHDILPKDPHLSLSDPLYRSKTL
ncbi:hypothetical protein K7432_010298, partial [Basidiobolus ranarum]